MADSISDEPTVVKDDDASLRETVIRPQTRASDDVLGLRETIGGVANRAGDDHLGLRETVVTPPKFRDTVSDSPLAGQGDPGALSILRNFDDVAMRYHEQGLIGRGGMGEVLAMFDAKIGREVALKTFTPGSPAEQRALELRFIREARVQALLEHPAIVPVYDMGIGPDGRPYFTMKRIRGETLFQVIEELRVRRRATVLRVGRHRLLSAFLTVCHAIEYAHGRGVIHRDLKPENVMLGPHGEVYILDWGVAKLTDGKGEIAMDASHPGEMLGTPGFMAPEQALGQHEHVGPQADVYALGAILYEILTFEPLHSGSNVSDIIQSTLTADRPERHHEGVPPELLRIALRATEFHTADRTRSARAISEAIEAYLDGDRDAGLRAKLADERARRAMDALSGSAEMRESGSADSRALALRLAGEALALMPEHQEAKTVLLQVLAMPPEDVPTTIRREVEAVQMGGTRFLLRHAWLRVVWRVVLLGFALLMGIRQPAMVALMVATMGISAVWVFASVHQRWSSFASRLTTFLINTATLLLVSQLFGWLLVFPVVVLVNGVLCVLQTPRKERPIYIVGSVLTILFPAVYEFVTKAGSSHFEIESITILPNALRVHPVWSPIFIVSVAVSGAMLAMVAVGRLKDQHDAAEEVRALQRWQLSQLRPSRPPTDERRGSGSGSSA